MAEIINLRRARKAKARQAAAETAASNRASHGRTRAAKSASAAEQDRRNALLDGAALTREEPE